MKKYLFYLLSLTQHFCFSQTNIYDTIVHNSLNRTFLLHIPPAYNPSIPTPLVIGLHGGGALTVGTVWNKRLNLFQNQTQVIFY